jgi:hypothetical protein
VQYNIHMLMPHFRDSNIPKPLIQHVKNLWNGSAIPRVHARFCLALALAFRRLGPFWGGQFLSCVIYLCKAASLMVSRTTVSETVTHCIVGLLVTTCTGFPFLVLRIFGLFGLSSFLRSLPEPFTFPPPFPLGSTLAKVHCQTYTI